MMASKTPFMLFLQFLHFLLGHPRYPGGQIPSFLLCIATISQDDGDTTSCVNCSDTSGRGNLERNSFSAYCSRREIGLLTGRGSISDLQAASGFRREKGRQSRASFSALLTPGFSLSVSRDIQLRGFT